MCHKYKEKGISDRGPKCPWNTGGEAGIRTRGQGNNPVNGLANRRLQPLSHLSVVKPVNIVAHLATTRRTPWLR